MKRAFYMHQITVSDVGPVPVEVAPAGPMDPAGQDQPWLHVAESAGAYRTHAAMPQHSEVVPGSVRPPASTAEQLPTPAGTSPDRHE